jgi:NAD(P)-dependent dehydrogenase (short-subunit alcohol dehydrogenase family)
MSKVWFVTGANSAIGDGIVRSVLDSGDSVVAKGRSMDKPHVAFADVENRSISDGAEGAAGRHR